jgi:LysM repeat protein
VLVTLVLLLPFVVLYQRQAQAPAPIEVQSVGSFNGRSQLLGSGATAWQLASRGNLGPGDTLRAIDDVRVTFGDSTTLDMAPAAEIKVLAMQSGDGRLTVAHQAGHLIVDTVNPLFRLESRAAALTVERAKYSVDVNDSGDTYVVGEQGLVYSTSDGETVAVAPGESLRTGLGQRARLQASTPVALPPPPPPPPRTPTATPTPVPPTPPPERIHIVARGDTLSEIAAKYGVAQDLITKANAMDNPNMLYVGQKLIIPWPK